MNNTVTITIKQFENFITRDLDSFTGIAKLQAAFDINKRYKIINIYLVYRLNSLN